ncbi:hypothetical protein CONPUDRAFT_136757 [Coniophora puteana RWD-64-598 SS2]|uniref:Uncharacterized protein n=1 Tax=Coniophora puteana (strain RWD-64-598) TaxID=741705 RepID=A0A5M3MST2_CONPW|nr:uncharacterized protein CONPUDRAFT_136757 [Coniophora puteana RWD-64-598 SS2]EIW82228.1 hypothetical protein CONPUDRAFT_136757 [Coniophora puteana RWD-64-598 SS2]
MATAMSSPALPSFIELMASLGLDNDAKPRPTTPSPSSLSPPAHKGRPRSGSASSVSSVLTDGSREHDDLRRAQRHRTVRYSPYISASSSGRLSKASSLTSLRESQDQDQSPQRSSSPSPPRRRRPSPLHVDRERERPVSMPISTYLRRKTPQNSPTVAMFPHRHQPRNDLEEPKPIMPPSLIPLLPPV